MLLVSRPLGKEKPVFQIETLCERPAVAPLACRLAYEAVLSGAGAHRSLLLQTRAEALAVFVRRGGARSTHVEAPGDAARRWLKATFRQDDDALLRAAMAALALGLDMRTADRPTALTALHSAAHVRLAAFLLASRPYAAESFSRDVAFAAGLASPAGALTVVVPERAQVDSLAPRARRAAGIFCRQTLQYGAEPARAWLAQVGVGAWAELHVDVRDLEDFSAEGFVRCHHRLAALMRTRPDLAGVYGASWLYDPQVAHVSPGLAFVRRTAEDGGAQLLRLRADPVQTACAVARSPARRRLVESGAYRPVCYGMYWRREALIDWSERALGAQTAGQASKRQHLQAARK